MKNKKTHKAAFTLIEIMIVVVIIGILATVIVPKIFDKPGQARTIKAQHDIRTLTSVLGLYKLDHFNYPSTSEGLGVLVDKYLEKLPKDPWNRYYIYINSTSDGKYQLYSYGADGISGGVGENQDIKK